MASPDHRSGFFGALWRFARWNPVNYWQVWLLCALPLFLAWLISYWVFLGKPLLGLVIGSILALLTAAVQSHRLGQRIDAATPAEWTEGRRSTRRRARKNPGVTRHPN